MAVQLILKNSNVEDKRPTAAQLANGEISLNYDEAGPFLCCKDTAGNVQQVGGVKIDETAPDSPVKQTLWFKPSALTLSVYDGAKWLPVAGGGGGGGSGTITSIIGNDGIDANSAGGIVTLDVDLAGGDDGLEFKTGKLSAKLATGSVLGSVKVGDNIDVTAGEISVAIATDTVLGVVKAGSNVSIQADGTLDVTVPDALKYRGQADLSTTPAGQLDPAVPVIGDAYINDTDTASIDVGWTPLTGPAAVGDLVVWNGSEWSLIPFGAPSDLWKMDAGYLKPQLSGTGVKIGGENIKFTEVGSGEFLGNVTSGGIPENGERSSSLQSIGTVQATTNDTFPVWLGRFSDNKLVTSRISNNGSVELGDGAPAGASPVITVFRGLDDSNQSAEYTWNGLDLNRLDTAIASDQTPFVISQTGSDGSRECLKINEDGSVTVSAGELNTANGLKINDWDNAYSSYINSGTIQTRRDDTSNVWVAYKDGVAAANITSSISASGGSYFKGTMLLGALSSAPVITLDASKGVVKAADEVQVGSGIYNGAAARINTNGDISGLAHYGQNTSSFDDNSITLFVGSKKDGTNTFRVMATGTIGLSDEGITDTAADSKILINSTGQYYSRVSVDDGTTNLYLDRKTTAADTGPFITCNKPDDGGVKFEVAPDGSVTTPKVKLQGTLSQSTIETDGGDFVVKTLGSDGSTFLERLRIEDGDAGLSSFTKVVNIGTTNDWTPSTPAFSFAPNATAEFNAGSLLSSNGGTRILSSGEVSIRNDSGTASVFTVYNGSTDAADQSIRLYATGKAEFKKTITSEAIVSSKADVGYGIGMAYLKALNTPNYWGWNKRGAAVDTLTDAEKGLPVSLVTDYQYPEVSKGLLIASSACIGFAIGGTSPNFGTGVQYRMDAAGFALGGYRAFDAVTPVVKGDPFVNIYLDAVTGDISGNNVTFALDGGGTLDVKDRLIKTNAALQTLKTAAAASTNFASLKAAIATALADI